MALTPYYYGSFNLNDGANYFILERQGMGMATVQESYSKIGRIEGMKKTGETTNERLFALKVLVLGTSRTDLENKFDTMLTSLFLRQQQLKIHSNDSRYFLADCIDVQTPFSQLSKSDPNGVQYCTVLITFLSLQPYAYASSTSFYSTGNQTMTLISGNNYKYVFNTASGGGNVYARPQITIIKNDALTWTALSIKQTTDGQTLTINNNLPSANGDQIDIYCDPTSATGYTAVLNSTTQCSFSGLFPVIEPGNTNWETDVTVASGVPVSTTAFHWTARWLS